ncbi:hypothetical protein [Halomonas piscis]|uniref:hypothetical protein n=1 Tax=Halomonas piscis TaxID=3031727 RepID=UPI0028998F8D|nr:hypothetical protein [Halomonas piscis]
MYPTHNTDRHQAACNAVEVAEVAGKRQQRLSCFSGGTLAGAFLAAFMGALALTVTSPVAQADETESYRAENAAGLFAEPLSSRQEDVASQRLSDAMLERIRGRYVQVRTPDHDADTEINSVILWDERPTGGGGADTQSSLNSGTGNWQSSSVTTGREQ